MPIAVNDVTYTYGAHTPFAATALQNLTLHVSDGELLGIMGHTGSGKSTLIQLLAGLAVPEHGSVLIDGEDINAEGYDKQRLRQKLGVVFQYPECQLFETTVQRDVAFGLRRLRLGREETEERVRWALETCGFRYEEVRKKAPVSLSGGEKRRVAIAGVLAVKPRYLILDEPFAGLDPLGREAFIRLMQELNRDGVSVILVSHNADCLGACAGRIAVLQHGSLILDGTPAEVFSDVERMRRLQLGVSGSRHAAWILKQRGLEIPQNITRYDELLPAIEEAVRRRLACKKT